MSNSINFENSYAEELNEICEKCIPAGFLKPEFLIKNYRLAEELGIDKNFIDSKECLSIFSGMSLPKSSIPIAQAYSGHQFGHFNPQLGDGRAINLGQVKGIDSNSYMLQLKGAGPTPYSRSGDGRAVLRSSIREYLCSEAMHHLHVPTTRALSLCSTGDNVVRDMFYDGNLAEEIGAVVCRVADSFIRFGNFEIFSAREDIDGLRTLLDFTIKHHFTEINDNSPEKYIDFFKEVISLSLIHI